MLSHSFILDLAIMLFCAKFFGDIAKRIRLPQVVGVLIAGLLIGPLLFNLVQESVFIDKMAELGVIVIMFTAGLETDIKHLKSTGKASIVIALIGIILPLIGGFLLSGLFNKNISSFSQIDIMKNILIGVILTATSVSITVASLQEMGKLKTKVGTAILGAAIIDDIIGIIILTIVISMGDSSITILSIFIKIILFFIFVGLCGVGAYYLFKKLYGVETKNRMPIYSFVFCLFLAFMAERFFDVADITGAYMAGIIIANITLSNMKLSEYLTNQVEVTSHMLLAPIFFASIGIKATVGHLDLHLILFSVALLVTAIATKIIGCGLGAKLAGFSNKDSLHIGTVMVVRGEVALVIADRGVSAGIMSADMLPAIIILVISTSLFSPILLKVLYQERTTFKG